MIGKEHAAARSRRERDKLPGRILQQIAACRGAANGLMARVPKGHIRAHVIGPERAPTKAQNRFLEDLLQVMKSDQKEPRPERSGVTARIIQSRSERDSPRVGAPAQVSNSTASECS